jgi:hypothetical protein
MPDLTTERVDLRIGAFLVPFVAMGMAIVAIARVF